MTPVIHKVFAYITNGHRLLVFRHTDFPEAGIQVPAGTVKPNERLEIAVLREAYEETGLQGLTIRRYLGDQIRNMEDVGKDEIHLVLDQLTCGDRQLDKISLGEPNANNIVLILPVA